MKIIVTGACGFIGSHVAEALVMAGHTVLGIDNLSTGKRENLPGRIDFANLDITDYYIVVGEFKDFKPEAVVHLAAQSAISTSWSQPIKDAHNNIMGTLAIIRACEEVKADRLVFSSTSAVYDENYKGDLFTGSPIYPTTPYGISKVAAEQYLKTLVNGMYVTLRFGNVYGPRQVPVGKNQVVPLMISHLLKGTPFSIHGDGLQTRDYVYVMDVVDAILKSIDPLTDSGVYNIAYGNSFSVDYMAEIIAKLCGFAGYTWDHDNQVDTRNVQMNIEKADKHFGWRPRVTPMEGLEKTVDWWKSQP
jgi:UDP-glucose 4-epimerase